MKVVVQMKVSIGIVVLFALAWMLPTADAVDGPEWPDYSAWDAGYQGPDWEPDECYNGGAAHGPCDETSASQEAPADGRPRNEDQGSDDDDDDDDDD